MSLPQSPENLSSTESPSDTFEMKEMADALKEKTMKTVSTETDPYLDESLKNSDSSDDEDEELPEPTNDYERFLNQFIRTDDARKLILHCANVRAAELEHKANCWKLLRLSKGEDLQKMFAILMKEEGAISLEQFELNAFIKPYSNKPFVEEADSSNYPAYAEQFFPSIAINNHFPDLGPVTTTIPSVLQTPENASILCHQPPLILDPKSYETRTEKTKMIGGKKKKTTVVQEPIPVFSKEQLKKCVPVPEWFTRYNAHYPHIPTAGLILRELDPAGNKQRLANPRSMDFKLISEEFDDEIRQYKSSMASSMADHSRELAIKFIEKRLETAASEVEPIAIQTFRRMRDNMTDEIAAEVNAIMRYKKREPRKYYRLEKALFLQNFEC